MPAYSFQIRFKPFIKDGTKTHTIRNFRKHPPKVGDKAHLFTGMRTKYCERIFEQSPDITSVRTIVIATGGIWIIDKPFLDEAAIKIIKERSRIPMPLMDYTSTLTSEDRDKLAWRDGFRHKDDLQSYTGCFDIMLRWFSITHSLPFVGNIIHWN